MGLNDLVEKVLPPFVTRLNTPVLGLRAPVPDAKGQLLLVLKMHVLLQAQVADAPARASSLPCRPTCK